MPVLETGMHVYNLDFNNYELTMAWFEMATADLASVYATWFVGERCGSHVKEIGLLTFHN